VSVREIRRTIRKSAAGVLVGTALLAAPAWPAGAQDACARLITDAADAFRIGRFSDVIDRTDACLAARPSSEERERAQALRANVFLALDQMQQAEAAASALLDANPEFTPAVDESERFRLLIVRIKRERAAEGVSSVSKMRESLLEAPATVVVVTGEQIRRRGYLDLEAVLHDLPAFDMSRTNGQTYSNAYQRGYRSDATNRTLFLVDGVEQNDLYSNIAYISRQYPLSNIDRVEVIYGPASTMYGANAFLGVINVITRDPEEALGEAKTVGGAGWIGGGAWKTNYFDATVAGRFRGASYSITGRLFKSDEWDLSEYERWNYTLDPDYTQRFKRWASVDGFSNVIATARDLDRAALQSLNGSPVVFSDLSEDWMVSGKLKVRDFLFAVQVWQTREGTASASTRWTEPGARNGAVWVPFQAAISARYSAALRGNVRLTYFGQAKIHELQPDSAAFLFHSYGVQLGMSDLCPNFVLTSCQPARESFWAQTFLAQSSNQVRNELNVVARPRGNLDLIAGVDLRNSSVQSDYLKVSTNCFEEDEENIVIPERVDPLELFFSIDSSEERATWDLLAPRISKRGGGFLGIEDGRPRCDRRTDESELPPPTHLAVRDIGVFAQASYRPAPTVKLVGGWRIDNGRVDLREGYGSASTPRLAFIYSPGPLVAKAIYAEAFKEPASLERFSTIPGIRERAESDNVALQPERVRNIEIALGRQTATYALDLSLYRSSYTNVIRVTEVSSYEQLNIAEFGNFSDELAECWYFTIDPFATCFVRGLQKIATPSLRRELVEQFVNNEVLALRFGNRDTLNVVGGQVNGSWRARGIDFYGNYSYTHPRASTDGAQLVTAGDIARHRANFGATVGPQRLNAGMRFNFVTNRPLIDSPRGVHGYLAAQGDRPRTDIPLEPGRPERIGGYLVAHLTATYAPVRGIAIQAYVENLFNTAYAHPGVQTADNVRFAASVPQPGRSLFVRLLTAF
jgi:outer membrane receptor protein involved in Fe transport